MNSVLPSRSDSPLGLHRRAAPAVTHLSPSRHLRRAHARTLVSRRLALPIPRQQVRLVRHPVRDSGRAKSPLRSRAAREIASPTPHATALESTRR